jgi:hypothetical protein
LILKHDVLNNRRLLQLSLQYSLDAIMMQCDLSDPRTCKYSLYIVCIECKCVIVYTFTRLFGVLHILWSDGKGSANSCAALCDGCIDKYEPDEIDGLYEKYNSSIPVDELYNSIRNSPYFKQVEMSLFLPTPLMSQYGFAKFIDCSDLPMIDEVDAGAFLVDACKVHGRADSVCSLSG